MLQKIIKALGKLLKLSLYVLLNAIGIYFFAKLVPGVEIKYFLGAVNTIILIAILNAFIFPIFARLTLPLTVFSLGIGGLIINALIILIVTYIMPSIQISNIAAAIVFIFGITIVNTLISEIFEIDNDEKYYRNVIKKQANKYNPTKDLKTPGVIFLQIDGLAFNVLRRAIQSGNVPNISRWLREGKYRLEKWETDWQSQTGASQAGILMGSNDNIPAFRWYEKKLGRVLAFGKPADLKIIEERLSNGKGLLFNNGASRGNLFSGNAEDTLLTVSSIGKKSKKGLGHGYFAYYSNPYNLPRTLILFVIEIFKEIKSIIEQGRRDVWPRLTKHKKIYPLLRASMTIVQRDVIIQTLMGDIFEGKDVVYADLTGYDEVSHHTGPERYETMGILRDLDKQIARLMRAIEDSEKPYHLVLLSDHGQTQGATFKQLTGMSLDEYISSIIGDNVTVSGDMDNKEDTNMINNAALEITKTGGLVGKSVGKVTNSNLNTNNKNFAPAEIKSDIKVLASGALGLIYFTNFKNRLTLEEIDKLHPNLINEIVSHPLIGFVLVDSRKAGGIVIGPEGEYYLETDKVIGKNPLENFGTNAVMHVKRTHGYSNVADIMINSKYDPVLNEVYAFEEQVGSHGAMGGDQMHPFVYFPSDWKFPSETIVSAENLHKQLKVWLKDLGQKT
jgi:putative membrane protein